MSLSSPTAAAPAHWSGHTGPDRDRPSGGPSNFCSWGQGTDWTGTRTQKDGASVLWGLSRCPRLLPKGRLKEESAPPPTQAAGASALGTRGLFPEPSARPRSPGEPPIAPSGRHWRQRPNTLLLENLRSRTHWSVTQYSQNSGV